MLTICDLFTFYFYIIEEAAREEGDDGNGQVVGNCPKFYLQEILCQDLF